MDHGKYQYLATIGTSEFFDIPKHPQGDSEHKMFAGTRRKCAKRTYIYVYTRIKIDLRRNQYFIFLINQSFENFNRLIGYHPMKNNIFHSKI